MWRTACYIILALNLLWTGISSPRADAAIIPNSAGHSRNSVSEPLVFEANRGQYPAPVAYVCRGRTSTFFFTSHEAILHVQSDPDAGGSKGAPSAVIRIAAAGAARVRRPEGISPLRGYVSYFLGRDQKRWRTGIPTFSRLRYTAVYPGIDLIYYGKPGQIEYDFVLALKARVTDIALRFSGAGKVALDKDGSLKMAVPGRDVLWHRPVAYQSINGRRVMVTDAYILLAGGKVGFRVGPYDKSKPLTIDPTLSFSTYIGGSSIDTGRCVRVDAAGNVYVAGETSSADFPTTPGAAARALPQSFDRNGHPQSHTFVLKFDREGELLYSAYLGGNNYENVGGIAADAVGNVYVTGMTGSTDFPTTPGSLLPSPARDTGAAYFTIINPSGTGLQYSTYLRGSGFVMPQCLAVDQAGNAYVGGLTGAADFQTTDGAFQKGFKGDLIKDRDAFFLKINPHLPGVSGLIYSTTLGIDGYSTVNGLAVDEAGNAYLTGSTSSPRFPTTPDALQPDFRVSGTSKANHIPYSSAFVAKIDPGQSDRASLSYSTLLGTSDASGQAITGDSAGNIYVAGCAQGGLPVTPGAFQEAYQGTDQDENIRGDAFVAKMDLRRSGTAGLLYLTYLGGHGGERADGIVLDSSGDAYVVGTTASYNFPVTADAAQKTRLSESAFVSVLSPDGSTLRYSTFLGGSNTTDGTGLALNDAGHLYVTGLTAATDFPTIQNALQPALGGQEFVFNAFLTVFIF